MRKLTVFIGCNRGSRFPDGPARVSIFEAQSTIARLLKTNGIDFATLSLASGVWNGEIEDTVRVEVYSDEPDALFESLAGFLADVGTSLRQDAFLVDWNGLGRIIGSGDRWNPVTVENALKGAF